MMSSLFFWLQTGLFALAAYPAIAAIRFVLLTRRPKNFPPGPPVILGLGNLHQIPIEKPWLKFQQWSKEYGDIIGLKVGPDNLVVLNNPQHVRELFDKRGAVYSGRPYMYIPFAKILEPEDSPLHILGLQNDNYLRRVRTTLRYLLSPAGLGQMMPLQSAQASIVMFKLLQKPEAFLEHFQFWSLATPMLVISGLRLEGLKPEFVEEYHATQKMWLRLLTPGVAPPVDLFPFLRWVPEFMASWKRDARRVKNSMYGYFTMLFENAKRDAEQKQNFLTHSAGKIESFLTKILREKAEGKNSFTDREILLLGGSLLDGSTDTPLATVESFMLMLAAHPEEQKRVQQEVDEVCGDRSPEGDDLSKLKYLKACLMEVFRLRPPGPMGLPHTLDSNDTYGEYCFPKGTTFIMNAYGMQHDERAYEDPYQFKPERFLENPYGTTIDAEQAETEGRRPTYTFGAGRRACPGDQLAQNSVLIAMAKLVWAFDLVASEPLDTSVETGYGVGLVLMPEKYKIDFKPRSEAKRQAVLADHARSLEVLNRLIGYLEAQDDPIYG